MRLIDYKGPHLSLLPCLSPHFPYSCAQGNRGKELPDMKERLFSWFETGTAGYKVDTKRRLVVTNVLITLVSAMTYFYAFALTIIDFQKFSSVIILMLIVGALFALTPRLHKKNHYLGSVYNLTIWLYYGISLFLVFGSDTGFHYFFLGGATGAIVIFNISRNVVSLISFVVQTSLFLVAEMFFPEPQSGLVLSKFFVSSLLTINVIVLLITLYCFVAYAFHQAQLAEAKLEDEHRYSERLLSSIMPQTIAAQLKREPEKTIAVAHNEVSILFADIVGFTKRSSDRPPEEVVDFLNFLFTRFDALAEKYELEKIKTLGDSFMVAGGMPEPQADHVERICDLALEMLNVGKEMPPELGGQFELRIGIHTGPAVAGVIGTRKPAYDVWGDTVNIAARLEKAAAVNSILLCETTKEKIEGLFDFTLRGEVSLKGKGDLTAWYLNGRV